MTKINLYKIDERYHRSFNDNIEEKLGQIDNKELTDSEEEKVIFKLYKMDEEIQKDINWNWILSEFEIQPLQISTQPKAVLIIEYNDEMYAVTFGSAFFLVDKFCDRNFSFEFARRMAYKEIKTTTLLSPNLQKNKNISTYINYQDLEFDSGESFAKLKAKLDLSEHQEPIIGEIVEFGNSIKLDLKESNLDSIVKLMEFIKLVLSKEEIYNIPVFKKVTDKEIIKRLEENLYLSIEENVHSIVISELDIIGVTEVFNNQDTFFELWHHHKNKHVEDLNISEIELFATEKDIDLDKEILNIKVKSFNNGIPIRTDEIKKLIDYVDDNERCVLNKGIWYHFNDDYQNYLEDSISEIQVIYNPEYNFSDELHNTFIDEKFIEERELPQFEGLTDEKIKEKLKNRYYAERAYNLMRVQDGFLNYDRITTKYANAEIELMDLYKEDTMYAVKIGNASSTLCYAVDQSISSLKMYKHKTLEGMPRIDNVAVWLVLKRQELPLKENGQPDLNALNMIMLKNKLDAWKKEVRLQGLTPVIYINYKI
ncbi:DUF6119 family protein [Lysinibacillus xylanilyticus]|uniref:DUF6119 family protein n=1 Tax=Lysinibacillus xylanilyticus TaxID=582475 RepID=UPI0036DC6D93